MPRKIPKFRGHKADMDAAAVWARVLCHLVYGPVAGERHYRQMPAVAVLSLWAPSTVGQA